MGVGMQEEKERDRAKSRKARERRWMGRATGSQEGTVLCKGQGWDWFPVP